jgi:hypothetical protein
MAAEVVDDLADDDEADLAAADSIARVAMFSVSADSLQDPPPTEHTPPPATVAQPRRKRNGGIRMQRRLAAFKARVADLEKTEYAIAEHAAIVKRDAARAARASSPRTRSGPAASAPSASAPSTPMLPVAGPVSSSPVQHPVSPPVSTSSTAALTTASPGPSPSLPGPLLVAGLPVSASSTTSVSPPVGALGAGAAAGAPGPMPAAVLAPIVTATYGQLSQHNQAQTLALQWSMHAHAKTMETVAILERDLAKHEAARVTVAASLTRRSLLVAKQAAHSTAQALQYASSLYEQWRFLTSGVFSPAPPEVTAPASALQPPAGPPPARVRTAPVTQARSRVATPTSPQPSPSSSSAAPASPSVSAPSHTVITNSTTEGVRVCLAQVVQTPPSVLLVSGTAASDVPPPAYVHESLNEVSVPDIVTPYMFAKRAALPPPEHVVSALRTASPYRSSFDDRDHPVRQVYQGSCSGETLV